eukprot:9812169-Karenia_brevis.AAC.1
MPDLISRDPPEVLRAAVPRPWASLIMKRLAIVTCKNKYGNPDVVMSLLGPGPAPWRGLGGRRAT